MYETKSMEGTSLFRSSSWHGLETHFPTQKEDSEMKNSPLHSPFWSFPNPTPPPKKTRFSQQSCISTLERCRMGFQSSVSKSPDDAPAYPNPPRTTSLHKREASEDTAGKMTLSFWGIIENVVQIYKDYIGLLSKKLCLCCHSLLQKTNLFGFNLFKIYQRPSGQLWHSNELLHMKKPSAHRHLEAFSTAPAHKVWGQKQPAKQVKFTEMTHII